MKRTLLATLLVISVMLLSGRVLANDTGVTHEEPTAKETRKELYADKKEARTTMKLEQKESRETLKAQFKEARKEAITNPELKAEMLTAAQKYLTAFGDNFAAHIDRVVAKLSTLSLLTEAQVTSFTGDLNALKLEIASVQASIESVTTFEGLKALRAEMRETFGAFKTTLKELRTAIKTAKETTRTAE